MMGCSTIGESVNYVTESVGEFTEQVGLVDKAIMKVPDYYSTKQLNKNYEFGQLYDVNHIDCSVTKNNCR